MTKLRILLLAAGLVSLVTADAQTAKPASLAKIPTPSKSPSPATSVTPAESATPSKSALPLKTATSANPVSSANPVPSAKPVSSANPAATAPPNFTLNVDLTTIATPLDKIYFSYYNTVTKVRFNDSANLGTVKKLSFKTVLTEPVLAQLRVVPTPPAIDEADTAQKKRQPYQAKDYLSVYIEPGVLTVTVKDSLSAAEVKGSASHKEFVVLQEKSKSYNETFQALYKELRELSKNKDTAGYDLKMKAVDSLDEVVKDAVYLSYLKAKGKTSPVALYALTQYAGYAIDPKKAEPAFNLLGTAYQNSPTGKNFKNRIELAKKTEVGQYAIPFSQNDTSGNAVTLASFKGKYVLIDFWASWCGPCRAENPNVVKAFNKYAAKGFTVLGISLDQPGKKEAWLKAIYDDQLAWTHVSDLKYWNNEIAQAYGIMAIPQNYLLDKEGKIVAKNIRGEELEKTLGGIFAGVN